MILKQFETDGDTVQQAVTAVTGKEVSMIAVRPLSPDSIPSALDKAKHYRLLNEPHEVESICMDILEVAPDHQEALITLLLGLTDNFAGELNRSFHKALEVAERLKAPYCRAYYTGIIYERRAKAHLKHGGPGSGAMAHGWFMKALTSFDQAMQDCDPGNQDAVLRWNSCARIINNNPVVKPDESNTTEMFLDSFETPH